MSSTATPSTGIGARIPRRELKRLLGGHGRYIDDIRLPRMQHACFVRSPHPHAKILSIDIEAAKQAGHRCFCFRIFCESPEPAN